MEEQFFKSLKSFISEFSGIAAEKIFENSRLEEDLYIYGDDAFELLIKYGKVFNVDVSKFMAADYFRGEGEVLLPFFQRMFTARIKSHKKALTVAHLVNGIIWGRLDEDVINKK